MSLGALLILLLMPTFAFGEEDCSPEALDITESTNIAEVLFYTGTCHFRNGDYDLSEKKWKELLEIKDIDPEYSWYQISTLNNLGYLKFLGYGVGKDQATAVEYWKRAVSVGHQESEYHLCHAYADEKESTYNKELGIKHCDRAREIYESPESIDIKVEANKEILRQIIIYREKLQ